jgi:hypothetical protein
MINPIDNDDFEKDMKEFEARIKVLRAEYNQYLGGSLKYPPNFHEAQIRKIIKKYASSKGLKGVQRFQYFNLVAKFNTMIEFYGRRIRDKQDGIVRHYGLLSPEQEDQLKLTRQSNPSQTIDRGHIIADSSRQLTTVKSMFEVWNQRVASSSKPLAQMDFDRFKIMIQSKTEELCKVKGCKAVRYRIVLEKGQVKIKAKPIT